MIESRLQSLRVVVHTIKIIQSLPHLQMYSQLNLIACFGIGVASDLKADTSTVIYGLTVKSVNSILYPACPLFPLTPLVYQSSIDRLCTMYRLFSLIFPAWTV